MPGKLFIYLFTATSQFVKFVLRSSWMLIVITVYFAVAVKTEWHRIVDVVAPALTLWNEVVHFDVHAAGVLA
jgi:hypothetical protein